MLKFICVLLAATAIGACSPFQSYVGHSPQPYVEISPRSYYVVQLNDNLYSIAFRLEVTPGQLRRANPWLNPVYIEPGTRLYVPPVQEDGHYAESNNNYHGDKTYDQTTSQVTYAGYVWPLRRVEVSSRFGRRKGRLHAGIDLRAPRGTPIYASAAGRVIFSGYNRGYGHMIVINHGGGIETAYAHNSRNIAQKGQQVKQGQIVARVGKSGNATGYHVHFEFRKHGQALNPVRHVQAAL